MKARATFVPSYFFENMDGELKFLPYDLAYYGQPLEKGKWMVTVGPGLMLPSAIAYMYKRLSLTDWVGYSEKFGSPGIIAKTESAKDSAQWEEMVDALDQLANEFSAVIGKNDEITSIDYGQSGTIPYPQMIERMDRALASIWRGADLSTISAGAGSGQGASLQEQESDVLEQSDAQIITETLNETLDRAVIRWQFGDETPAAFIKIIIPAKRDMAIEINVDKHLLESGVKLSKRDALERYSRVEAESPEDSLSAPATPNTPSDEPRLESSPRRNGKPDDIFSNETARQLEEDKEFMLTALGRYAEAERQDFAPIADRIEKILVLQNEKQFMEAVTKFRSDLPDLLRKVNGNPRTGEVLAEVNGTAFLNGRFN
jgi:phage gp29-like protein